MSFSGGDEVNAERNGEGGEDCLGNVGDPGADPET